MGKVLRQDARARKRALTTGLSHPAQRQFLQEFPNRLERLDLCRWREVANVIQKLNDAHVEASNVNYDF
jgi:hypothetical protein